MAKKKVSASSSRAAAKKAKVAQKEERKEGKKKTKSKDEEEDDQDLEGILERYFYNDVFRYSPEKDEWRKFVSPTCPGPRSAHAVVASPAGGGKLFLFGGEFSSLYQNTFHHYRDFWCFDISTHMWDRIDTKVRPTARSGHRMAMWKHYIVLFGGFYDPGIRTNYLNDLWIFDTQEYKWKQYEFRDNDRKPSPRGGFSFLPSADGVILHGGYCKEYVKGSRPMGVMLDDTWFLRMTVNVPIEGKTSSTDPLALKWERRKRPTTAYAPSLRSGCTMALWTARNMGILFGGVTDEDTSEETMESVFYNDLYGYQISGNGKWVSMTLKRPKKKAQVKSKRPAWAVRSYQYEQEEDNDDSNYENDEEIKQPISSINTTHTLHVVSPEADPDDPNLTIPIPRYNAMLAVLRNTLYIYGGIFERGAREYTLDDFYSLPLDKLDRYNVIKGSDVDISAGADESSDEDEEEDEDNDNESDENDENDDDRDDESTLAPDSALSPIATVRGDDDDVLSDVEEMAAEHEVDMKKSLRTQAAAFMGVAKDTERSLEDMLSTPLPGETIAMFYARSREYWIGKAHNVSGNRGKLLRRDGFALASERYEAYKPILDEVEKILAEAGLDEEEMRKGAVAGASGPSGQSRNRR
ncbi:hypothetical protein EUX98_g3576 [Antrodiella citrinella]|uniref:DUF4110 domain-containing protein n=1 Tax=Antrodiella citrinella TaxID=2447956 RepID=A0A4S4MX91_9APHY|nr:hypothetical protein EUX98_g3576 [Antrodiella citrinella]